MIGVFDSGSGGLTILQALRETLPERDFLYVGDHARAPYGEREGAEVHEFTRQAVDYLLGQNCRLIILACNTAAAVALRPLQQGWLAQTAPHARVLGVHVPLVESITGLGWNAPVNPVADHGAICTNEAKPRTLGIFATPRTVTSGAFKTEIKSRAPAIHVLQQPCPGLADAIEAHAPDERIEALVRGYVDQLMAQPGADAIDSVALACTHYPFALKQFRAALSPAIAIHTQPRMVALALANYLKRHPDIDDRGAGHLRLLTSTDPLHLNGLASRLPAELRRFEALPAPLGSGVLFA
ncbi:glutamate racemase [Iodidimonas nitroreducens]|uniref:Glutamate racemase n=1 Tax=Iodidimonas nitroreducens TaxID=1236968 RepID=A0A5A7N8N0_9PROT|nr:aspartate/glutamate racemase family protein [Iodidimonas nitroreducens]GAK33553.1 glutamate racemase [alpha proteobacterium Q-1]GER03760.1 glutamate racemase [Iodidimonas nitroreducens]